jgi:hypothetical protein
VCLWVGVGVGGGVVGGAHYLCCVWRVGREGGVEIRMQEQRHLCGSTATKTQR